MAEGNGLLNRRTGNACTGGSNPPLSVIIRTLTIKVDVLFNLGLGSQKGGFEPPVEFVKQITQTGV